jgi:PAS domain S-box-containing protein
MRNSPSERAQQLGAEERVRALLDASPGAVVVVDERGTILVVNPRTEELFGYARTELLGEHVEMLVPSRVRRRHRSRRTRYLAEPRARPMGEGLELHGMRKDGSEFPVEIGLSPLPTERGVLVAALIRDLSEQKRTQELADRLQLLHDLDRAILAADSPEAIAEVCAERLRPLTSSERVAVYRFDVAKAQATLLAVSPSGGPGFQPGESFPLAVLGDASAMVGALRRGEVYLLDLARSAAKTSEIEMLVAAGMRFYTVTPLIAADELIGALSFRVDEAETLRGDERDVALEVSAQMAIAIQQADHRRSVRDAEARYHSLYDRVPVGVFRTLPDGTFLEVNPGFVEMLGFPDADALKAVNARSLYADPRERERLLELLGREGTVRDFEVRLLRRDGRALVCSHNVRAVHDPHGNFLYFESVSEDITERELARRALEERARLAQYAADVGKAVTEVEDLPSMLQRVAQITVARLGGALARLWTLNETGDVLELRASAGMYTDVDGAHERIPVGTSEIGQIASERAAYFTDRVIGDPRVSDQQWARREGMVSFAGCPLLVEDRLIGVMAMFAKELLSETTRDALAWVASGIALGIEHRRTTAALREALHRAQESDRLKTAFLANVSHEFRTPLNVIVGYSDVLRSELSAEDQAARKPLFDGIRRASDRLIQTVHSVLDVAKLEAKTFEMKTERVALRSVIEEQVSVFQARAGQKGLRLVVELTEPQAAVTFDRYCLSTALRHILDNAVKFTEAGAVTLRLGRDADGRVLLEVRDTGIGIDASFQARLFQPFSQERSGYARPFEGSGLGLALAKRFFELGGAELSLESAKGKGTTVRVRFEQAIEVGDRGDRSAER